MLYPCSAGPLFPVSWTFRRCQSQARSDQALTQTGKVAVVAVVSLTAWSIPHPPIPSCSWNALNYKYIRIIRLLETLVAFSRCRGLHGYCIPRSPPVIPTSHCIYGAGTPCGVSRLARSACVYFIPRVPPVFPSVYFEVYVVWKPLWRSYAGRAA